MRWWTTLAMCWALVFGYATWEEPIKKWTWQFVEPEPYHSVTVVRSIASDNSHEFAASFIKNGECELHYFRVIGFWDGIPEYLHYNDRHGLPHDYDRSEGEQFLWIDILFDFPPPDYIELRTSHDCGGPVRTRRVFFTIDLTL
jgi:hypothetical protein